MDQIECTKIALTVNEKKMIIFVHNYIKEKMKMSEEQAKQINDLRKEVSKATGVDEATIARIVAEFNKTGNVTSSEQGHRPSKDFQVEYMNAVHELILSANRNGLPLSLRDIVFELSELGFVISKAQLARDENPNEEV
ncbi:17324_t:CDS:2 [Gigaspora margarita]|uniref:17323_t:CDS:1 n=1 Tax=Gigaspora margarita TaxID=4874 RepID=A0ABN7UID0_GIGMA|nr:17323_t:CDS:2 [Gigaspora margarita]CAG8604386.1 17324_t:CDS:2 [Gigaspora margarita]